MSEKSQEPRDEEKEDLLEQIFTRELNQMKASTQTAAAEESPELKYSGESSPPANRKSRRSAVYLYLLILFGAAFLMLLLAYFVQQRNSESMKLSREELSEKIADLEQQVYALRTEAEDWKARYNQARESSIAYQQENSNLSTALYNAIMQRNGWENFWTLEQYFQAGDYESCAAILLMQVQAQFTFRTPDSAQDRRQEIMDAVIDADILDEDFYQNPDKYSELLKAYLLRNPLTTEKP